MTALFTIIKRISAAAMLIALAATAAEAKTQPSSTTKKRPLQTNHAKSSKSAASKSVASKFKRGKSSKSVATPKKRGKSSKRVAEIKTTDIKASTASLYQEKAAQKIDPSQLSFFGPQASKFSYDKRMVHAADLAAARARAHSHGSCWRYVKDALISAGLVDSRPKTAYAKEAGSELANNYGFTKIRVSDPYKAPLGSVIVYGGRGAGHVEFRTKTGFVSDFTSLTPSKRPLIGVYIKS